MAARVTDAHVRLIVGIVALVFSLDYWLPLRPPRPAAPEPRARQPVGRDRLHELRQPPAAAALHLLPQRLPNATYAATAVAFFTVVNLVKVPAYASLGQLGSGNP